MVVETELLHVRQVTQKKNEKLRTYKKFSVCGTSTGWFGCKKKDAKRHKEIEKKNDAG